MSRAVMRRCSKRCLECAWVRQGGSVVSAGQSPSTTTAISTHTPYRISAHWRRSQFGSQSAGVWRIIGACRADDISTARCCCCCSQLLQLPHLPSHRGRLSTSPSVVSRESAAAADTRRYGEHCAVATAAADAVDSDTCRSSSQRWMTCRADLR